MKPLILISYVDFHKYAFLFFNRLFKLNQILKITPNI